MKVYFINPPATIPISREGRCMIRKSAWAFTLPPISLAYCAAILREEGFEVKIIDCIAEGINQLVLKEKIKQYNPDIIILNTATSSIVNDIKIADDIKEINPLVKVGVIGIHPSSLPDETFSLSKGLDYIIRGEPEFTIRDLALALDNNQPLSKVEGISYRIGEKIFHNSSRELIKDLDSLPFPAWDLININNYKLPFTNEPFLLIVPSRGCPHQCIFCNARIYYGDVIRLRSVKKVISKIEWVKNNFGVKNFHFWTESFTLNRDFALEISKEILKRNIQINWTCNSRVDNVDLELLEFMKKAGCWMISFGIESGDQCILDNAKKGITLEQSIDAVKLAKKAGLEVSIQCIIGLPGETKKTALKTIAFAKSLNADYAQFYCAVPFPGSDLYHLAKEKNWLSTKDWSKFDQSQSVLNIDTLKAVAIMRLRRNAYFNYYLSPKQFFRTLKKIITSSDLKNLIPTIKNFLNWI